jgi:predicted flap endonuclease-1-like 5' DNA nuclease
MQIEELLGLNGEEISWLQAAGIRNYRQLLRASQRPERFQALAQSTALPPETLRRAVGQAELSQIRGIGPTTLAHLVAVEVEGLAGLAQQEPQVLQARLQQVTARPPNLALIESWIQQAQRLGGRRG